MVSFGEQEFSETISWEIVRMVNLIHGMIAKTL